MIVQKKSHKDYKPEKKRPEPVQFLDEKKEPSLTGDAKTVKTKRAPRKKSEKVQSDSSAYKHENCPNFTKCYQLNPHQLQKLIDDIKLRSEINSKDIEKLIDDLNNTKYNHGIDYNDIIKLNDVVINNIIDSHKSLLKTVNKYEKYLKIYSIVVSSVLLASIIAHFI